MSYAELHCLSNFSFLRGASHPFELMRQAKALGYTALAITDECSLAGIVRAHEVAKEVDLKLIIGSEFHLADGTLVLIAPDHEAYTQLCKLITRARRAAEKGTYIVTPEDFEGTIDRCFGIWICRSAPRARRPSNRGQGPLPQDGATWFSRLPLADRWLGFQHHLEPDSDSRLQQLTAMGQQLQLPLVACGDVHYHIRERRRLQDTLTAVRLGQPVSTLGHALFPNGERHLRPRATLHKLYPSVLIDETLRIAERCTFRLDHLRYEYPHELVPEGRTATGHLRALAEAGLRKRWPQGAPLKVQEQVKKELALIADLKYEHYFLTVADLVDFAKSKDIFCQGRGSAANSVVCYALGVTEVNPERINMLFERFISRERAEPPDIDIDFEHQRREEVIQYVYSKYGRDRAALAATVIRYRPRSAIRDVGKALGLPLDKVDRLAKSFFWFDGSATLPDRLHELGMPLDAPVIRQFIELVNELVGFPRHLSQHVGGFVMSERPLSTLVPVENAAMPGRTIIQWDKDDLESLNMLKVDCLALGMLSAIRRSLEMISRWRGKPFEMADIPPEDSKTYDMLCRGESVGVFQVESRAQMSMLPRLKPKEYYDLVIQVAIVRPGPIQGGMVHPYLRRRQKLEPVEFPSDELKEVLAKTDGVPLFQEQVMQIAIVAAGFTPGEADQVRRSMAAWQRRGGLEHFRTKLISGMLAKGYAADFAERIYQQVLGFGSYGFPESHAASFALLAYVSAWLKCHEPAAFCAGLLNSQPMGFYAPAQLVADARRSGVVFFPPDVQVSEWDCTLENDGSDKPAVRLGLRMIAGLPEEDGRRIAEARQFRDLDDLVARAKLNNRSLSRVTESGALNRLVGHRHQARWAALGVERLPELLQGHSAQEPESSMRTPTEGEDIVTDYRSLGLTLGRHPLELLRPRLRSLRVSLARELVGMPANRTVRVAGLVTHRQRPETASGVMFISLEDESGISNLILRQDVQKLRRPAILAAQLMVVTGRLQKEQDVIHVLANDVRDYSRWLGRLSIDSRNFR